MEGIADVRAWFDRVVNDRAECIADGRRRTVIQNVQICFDTLQERDVEIAELKDNLRDLKATARKLKREIKKHLTTIGALLK